jgi:manganese efflux pump family protein
MLALLLVAPLLGLDNFAAAATISVARSDWRTCVRVCAIFGGYALVAPLVGLLLGERFAVSIGESGRGLGGVVLIVIGLRGLIGAIAAPDEAARRTRDRSYDLRAILLIGLTVSTDTLAAGFGLGLYGVPIPWAVLVTCAATVLMSWAGFRVGGVVARRVQGWGDGISSAALALIGGALLTHLI